MPFSWPGAPESVPTGLISVMPQPWTTCSPCRSPNASIIARGGAAPPTVIIRSAERSHFPGFASRAWRIPIQIVGTPAVTVTCCSASPSSSVSGSMCGPGKTCLTPVIVDENGKHHAFAWNIGTTGSETSPAWMPRHAFTVSACRAIARCE